MTVLAGDDALTLPMMAVGGKGVISVTSNVVPSEMAQLVKAFLSGRIDEARRIHFALSPLFTRALLRDQSDSGENCAGHDGENRSGAAVAALCHGDRDEGPTHAGLKGCRPHLVVRRKG